MQDAIPYTERATPPPSSSNSDASHPPTPENTNTFSIQSTRPASKVEKLVAENPVIVFGRRGCCMCHVVKRLLLGHGVNPPVVEVDEEQEAVVIGELSSSGNHGGQGGMEFFPVVFIGGKLFGGLERVMASHISGELVPLLKQAGALWL